MHAARVFPLVRVSSSLFFRVVLPRPSVSHVRRDGFFASRLTFTSSLMYTFSDLGASLRFCLFLPPASRSIPCTRPRVSRQSFRLLWLRLLLFLSLLHRMDRRMHRVVVVCSDLRHAPCRLFARAVLRHTRTVAANDPGGRHTPHPTPSGASPTHTQGEGEAAEGCNCGGVEERWTSKSRWWRDGWKMA